jgi:hypothetical protein
MGSVLYTNTNKNIMEKLGTIGTCVWSFIYCITLIVIAWVYYIIEPLITNYFKRKIERLK